MAVSLIDKARCGREFAVQARAARKSGAKPIAISIEKAKLSPRFQPTEDLMSRFVSGQRNRQNRRYAASSPSEKIDLRDSVRAAAESRKC